MATRRNLLIVEDEEEWQDVYSRYAAKLGIFTIHLAEDLATAESLIDVMPFAVAFIDIGLNPNDDQNVDGLLVMEKIRSVDEATSIVVVTGRPGRDETPTARAALKRFHALDNVAKAGTTPGEIHRLLRTGLDEYEKRVEAGSVRQRRP